MSGTNDIQRGQVRYEQLARVHADYEGSLWHRLKLLRDGGYSVKAAAKDLLVKLPNEPNSSWQYRITQAAYVPYFGAIVDHLIGALFEEPLTMSSEGTVDGFWQAFAADCDREGTPFNQLMREVTSDAVTFGKALVGWDMLRQPDEKPANRAQEYEMGLSQPYLERIPIGDLLNWADNPGGTFKWCVLHSRVPIDTGPLGNVQLIDRFKVWELVEVLGKTGAAVAAFSVYETKPFNPGQEPPKHEELRAVAVQQVTSFHEIPIRCLRLPHPLWLGNAIGPLCEEHFRRRSDLSGAMARSLVEIPYVKRGPEVPALHAALPSNTQQNPWRGEDPVGLAREQGFVALGSDDDIGFASPSGRAFDLASRELDKLRDEIFRVVASSALSIANSASAVRRSGESKKEDRSATTILLEYLGGEVAAFAVKLYEAMSRARLEQSAWTANGLDDFQREDRGQLAAEAAEAALLNIPSTTFSVMHMTRVAHALLPNATPEQKRKIEEEIAAAVARAASVDDDVFATLKRSGAPET